MKKYDFRQEEFFEFELNPNEMNKLHGGDGPIPPTEPPDLPPPK
jgi:hypothetical protein